MTIDADFKLWDGVYRSFAEAPASGPGFAGDTWRDRSLALARETLQCLEEGRQIDKALRQRNAVLPGVLKSVLSKQARVRVLDLGGGLGFGYLAMADALGDLIGRIDYCIVEVPTICEAGRELFAGKPGPRFSDDIGQGSFDVAYACSMLQYIDDWKTAIGTMANLKPSVFVISDIFTGDFETYATLQTYYESRIPYWFFNANELTQAIEEQGFRLRARINGSSTILGQDGQVPMDNFPDALRVCRASHFLFSRVGSEDLMDFERVTVG